MCLARRAQARETTKKIAAIATKTPENTISIKADRRLNPSATEFVSSRSESETSSVGDDAESEHLEHLEAIQKTRQSKGAEAHQPMDQYPSEDTNEDHRFNSYHNHGWESPQVRLYNIRSDTQFGILFEKRPNLWHYARIF
jgi:hypothetical protein